MATLDPRDVWSSTSLDTDQTTYTLSSADDTITLSSIPYSNTITSTTYTMGTGIGSTDANIWVSNPIWSHDSAGKLNLDGDEADVVINGKSLKEAIEKIEERLNILTPNPNLEQEWAELKALGEQYRALEKHILEKQATWDKLKAMPPPEID